MRAGRLVALVVLIGLRCLAADQSALVFATVEELTNSVPTVARPHAVVLAPGYGLRETVFSWSSAATNAVSSPNVLPTRSTGRWILNGSLNVPAGVATYVAGWTNDPATGVPRLVSFPLTNLVALAGTNTFTGANTFTAPITATNGIITRAANDSIAFFAGWTNDPSTGVARFVSANSTQVQGFLGWSTLGQLANNQTWSGSNTFSGALISPGSGANSTKLGNASAGGSSASAVGNGASASGTESVAIGASSGAGSLNSVAVGAFASASSQEAAAFGPYSSASGSYSTALGDGASAGHGGSTAVGRNAATTAGNQVRLGTSSDTVSVPGSLNVDGGIDLPSGSPGSPGSGGRLYVYTNGGGKLVLAVKFPDGSSVNIATQP